MAIDRLPVGWVRRGDREEKLSLPITTLRKSMLVTGTSGWGKTGFLYSLILQILTLLRDTNVTLIDMKGEAATDLIDSFIPALTEHHPEVGPARVVTVHPFGRYGVRLNPLCPVPGLLPEVQASIVCGALDALVDGGFGPRMTSMLAWLIRGAIAAGGTLLDILDVLHEPARSRQLATRLANGEVRHYHETVYGNESQATRDALRARLEWLLVIPAVRAQLCSRSDDALSGDEILNAKIAVVDLASDLPQGFVPLAECLGSLIMARVTGAVFSRGPESTPVTLVCDEFQGLVKGGRGAAADLERLLSQARFRKVNCILACQSLSGQIADVSPALIKSAICNCAVFAAFRPNEAEIKHLLPLLPITGRRVDPERPDQVLTLEAERRRYLSDLGRLPPRHALLADFVAGRADIIRTLDVPYEEARRRAARVPPAVRESFRRGKFGVPTTELVADLERRGARLSHEDVVSTNAPSGAGVTRSRMPRSRHPPLVLP